MPFNKRLTAWRLLPVSGLLFQLCHLHCVLAASSSRKQFDWDINVYDDQLLATPPSALPRPWPFCATHTSDKSLVIPYERIWPSIQLSIDLTTSIAIITMISPLLLFLLYTALHNFTSRRDHCNLKRYNGSFYFFLNARCYELKCRCVLPLCGW